MIVDLPHNEVAATLAVAVSRPGRNWWLVPATARPVGMVAIGDAPVPPCYRRPPKRYTKTPLGRGRLVGRPDSADRRLLRRASSDPTSEGDQVMSIVHRRHGSPITPPAASRAAGSTNRPWRS
jgi:hypothetical protein